jgi:hypothetical protein
MKLYNAKNVAIVIAGIPISSIGGFADGSFVEIKQATADYVTVIGTDGQVTRCRTNDRRATVKVKLMQSSDANAALSILSNLDLSVSNGSAIGPMLIMDNSGKTMYSAAHCWIAQCPDVDFDREAKSREWTIECAALVRLELGENNA